MLNELRRNPALLKLDLYCKGVRVSDSCLVEEDGGRKILRTRAGLGSGLEIILPGNLWTNVPVTEPFAAASPYTLHREDGRYLFRWNRLNVTTVELSPPEPLPVPGPEAQGHGRRLPAPIRTKVGRMSHARPAAQLAAA